MGLFKSKSSATIELGREPANHRVSLYATLCPTPSKDLKVLVKCNHLKNPVRFVSYSRGDDACQMLNSTTIWLCLFFLKRMFDFKRKMFDFKRKLFDFKRKQCLIARENNV